MIFLSGFFKSQIFPLEPDQVALIVTSTIGVPPGSACTDKVIMVPSVTLKPLAGFNHFPLGGVVSARLTRPTWLPCSSVNQRLLSGPLVIPVGVPPAVG